MTVMFTGFEHVQVRSEAIVEIGRREMIQLNKDSFFVFSIKELFIFLP